MKPVLRLRVSKLITSFRIRVAHVLNDRHADVASPAVLRLNPVNGFRRKGFGKSERGCTPNPVHVRTVRLSKWPDFTALLGVPRLILSAHWRPQRKKAYRAHLASGVLSGRPEGLRAYGQAFEPPIRAITLIICLERRQPRASCRCEIQVTPYAPNVGWRVRFSAGYGC